VQVLFSWDFVSFRACSHGEVRHTIVISAVDLEAVLN